MCCSDMAAVLVGTVIATLQKLTSLSVYTVAMRLSNTCTVQKLLRVLIHGGYTGTSLVGQYTTVD